MIWFSVKFIFMFFVSFLILSIQINSTPLFGHLTKLVGPLGTEIQKSFSKSIGNTVKESKKIGKDLFNNSKPKGSAAKFQKVRSQIQEDIKQKEKNKLDSLIKKN